MDARDSHRHRAYGGFICHQLVGDDARYSMPVIAVALVGSWFLVVRLGRDAAAVELPEVRTVRELLVGATSPRMLDALRLVELGWLLARFPLILIGTLLLAVQFGWDTTMPALVAVAAAGYRSLTDRRLAVAQRAGRRVGDRHGPAGDDLRLVVRGRSHRLRERLAGAGRLPRG
ncbi:hypothetical protein [Actinophytocola sp.]|uniref:hypothetical protein n=1 Tax=Actinophytocola sp. TaxID=1872138 RepID=UPI003899FF31